jgi:hypothetical protein
MFCLLVDKNVRSINYETIAFAIAGAIVFGAVCFFVMHFLYSIHYAAVAQSPVAYWQGMSAVNMYIQEATAIGAVIGAIFGPEIIQGGN